LTIGRSEAAPAAAHAEMGKDQGRNRRAGD